MTLWAALIATEITREAGGSPQLSGRAFAILLAAAITTTIGGLLASLAVPLQAAFALGMQHGRFAEQQRRLIEGVEEPGAEGHMTVE